MNELQTLIRRGDDMINAPGITMGSLCYRPSKTCGCVTIYKHGGTFLQIEVSLDTLKTMRQQLDFVIDNVIEKSK